MSVQLSYHCRLGLRVVDAAIHPSNKFATLTLGENGDERSSSYPTNPVLYFTTPEDIITLTVALQKLANDFAAVQPDAPKADAPIEVGA